VRFEADGRSVEADARVGPRSSGAALELILPKVRTWSPESPAPRDARVRVLDTQKELDRLDRFVRLIGAKGREILLDRRPPGSVA
jgi:hypothetical protein